MPALDFSPLDGPMPHAESVARRRSMLAGRSLFSELGTLRLALLIIQVVSWPVVLAAVGVAVSSVVTWFLWNGPTQDWSVGYPLVLLAAILLLALCVVLARFTIIPPAWGRWVRMQRFAEVNGLSFIRIAREADVPLGFGAAAPLAALMSDAFTDPLSGVVLGNSGSGFGAQGFVLVRNPSADVVDDGEPLSDGAQPLGGFDVRATPQGTLAVRFTTVRMRNSVIVRRMFATADAIRSGDLAAIR